MSCPSGATVKAGISPTAQILVDRSLWETVTGAASSWFDWLLDIFVPVTITASDLCALNLSDPVLPNSTDLAGAFFKDPSSLLNLRTYIRDKLRYSAFAATCECSGSSSPCYSIFGRPFSSLPNSETAGAWNIDVGMQINVIAACDLTTFAFRDITPSGSTTRAFKLWDLTAGTLLWTQNVVITSTAYQEVACTTVTTLISGHNYVLTYRWSAGDTVLDEATGYGGASTADFTCTGRIDNYSAGTAVPFRFFSGIAYPVQPIVCPASGPPTAPAVPTQPVDFPVPPAWACTTIGDVCIRLQQLSQKVDWLIRAAPLVTNRSVSESTAHAGLTGTGTIAVTGIVGLRVVLTTIPGYIGSAPGTPALRYGVGRIDLSTAEGFTSRKWLSDTPLEITDIDPLVRSVDYTLHAGVVATIIELRQGP